MGQPATVACKQLKVPAALHQQSTLNHQLPRHGFGLQPNGPKPAAKWIECFEEWLEETANWSAAVAKPSRSSLAMSAALGEPIGTLNLATCCG